MDRYEDNTWEEIPGVIYGLAIAAFFGAAALVVITKGSVGIGWIDQFIADTIPEPGSGASRYAPLITAYLASNPYVIGVFLGAASEMANIPLKRLVVVLLAGPFAGVYMAGIWLARNMSSLSSDHWPSIIVLSLFTAFPVFVWWLASFFVGPVPVWPW